MFVLDLLPGGILCYFWLIHFESGTVKILLWRTALCLCCIPLVHCMLSLGFICRNKELKNQQNHFATPKLSLSAATSWKFPFFDLFLLTSIPVQRLWHNILLYPFILQKGVTFLPSQTHTFGRNSHTYLLSATFSPSCCSQ